LFRLSEKLEKANNLVKRLEENEKIVRYNRKAVAENKQQKELNKIGIKAGLQEARAYQTFLNVLSGNTEKNPLAIQSLREMTASTDIINMIPKIIQGEMIEAADPEYLAANFFTKISVPDAQSVVVIVPIIGELSVKEVQEGSRYDEDAVDYTLSEKTGIAIDIKKYGIKVSITEEAMMKSTWDIYNTNVRKIGRAFARFKEQLCMSEFSKHGHIVYDNAIRSQTPSMGTTGRAEDGSMNNTLSVEDFLNIMLTAIAHDKRPTDCLMHPAVWTVFARNAMIGAGLTWGALGAMDVHPNGGTQGTPAAFGLQNNMGPQKFIMTPEQTQNRLPMPLTINFTPWVRMDKENKLFDMYILDKSNIGVIAQQTEITMDNWTDPERDIRFIKAKERYGVGINADTNGIMVARNIAVAPTYPKPPQVEIITVEKE
jgi:HK97 family phage major capsid protein